MPGEGNAKQALYWQVSDDAGLTWTAPRAALDPIYGPSGLQLPMWSPVLHTHVGSPSDSPLHLHLCPHPSAFLAGTCLWF